MIYPTRLGWLDTARQASQIKRMVCHRWQSRSVCLGLVWAWLICIGLQPAPAQGCENMNGTAAASVARLEQQLDAGNLSLASLDREINVLDSLLKRGDSCFSVTESVPREIAPSERRGKPSPQEAYERTFRTHGYRPTPEAGDTSGGKINDKNLAELVASLKFARSQRPLDLDAVRRALGAIR